jgi:cold shock CspA family protein
MPKGKVLFYDVDRGFGYIVPDDGSPDVCVDESALNAVDFLVKDQRVWYELIRGAGEELRALNVVPLAELTPW